MSTVRTVPHTARMSVTISQAAAAMLYANENGWRVSMRSLPVDVDVAAIAAEFGGGGHPRAAGLQIEGGEAEKMAFLERVAELIAERPEGAVAS